jgi:two-component system, NtrC family, nitrogen regulation sensor histidine kinase NtrY
MGFKNFRLNITIRVLLLGVSIFLLILVMKDKYITPIMIGGFIIFQVWSLIKYSESTNRNLANFLQTIRFADFSRNYKVEGVGESFDELQKAFNDIILDFQKIRAEKEEHYYYLQNIIQHIPIGIIAYQKNGVVEMINNAAKKLFQIYNLKNIKTIGSWSEALEETLNTIKAGENALVKVQDEEDILQLSVYATEFKLNDRTIKLVSIKNIQSELEEKEMESWQKLIRVLTHEIMNSIAPIASLSSTVNEMVKEISGSQEIQSCEIIKSNIEDIQNALETIHKRSTGLIHFVETYRNLTRIPKPNFTIFPISRLFDSILALLKDDLENTFKTCTIEILPENLEITADEQLIEQVVINLVKNSLHACEGRENSTIALKAYVNNHGKVCIQVADNGKGIIKDVKDKIFIPFFTTKPQGSGIGLSLSKQILRLHGGSISVKSEPEVETLFTLIF